MDERSESVKRMDGAIALTSSCAVLMHAPGALSEIVIKRHAKEISRRTFFGNGSLFSVGTTMADQLVAQGPQRIRFMSPAPLIKLLAFIDAGRRVAVAPLQQQPSHALLELPDACQNDNDILRWFMGQLVRIDSSIDETARLLRGSEPYQLIRFLLASDSVSSVEQLGDAYGLSPSHFRRKCHFALGRPLKMELRLLRAARSLLDTSHRPRSFTRIAEDHGFASSAHFSSDIKGLTGMCPSEIYERKICGY